MEVLTIVDFYGKGDGYDGKSFAIAPDERVTRSKKRLLELHRNSDHGVASFLEKRGVNLSSAGKVVPGVNILIVDGNVITQDIALTVETLQPLANLIKMPVCAFSCDLRINRLHRTRVEVVPS